MQNRRLLTIFTIVFIDLLGFGLILPLLPYYADRFDASSTLIGLLIAIYSAAQLVGGPLLGRLSDQYGRRPILLVSIFGTFVGFLLLGAANTLWLLFVSRVLDGLTGGNISVARAYITDITGEENRAKGMGVIGAAFGLGFVVGPAVGGVLSSGGNFALPAFAAAGLAFANMIAIYLWLPESHTAERRAAMQQQGAPAFAWVTIRRAIGRPGVGPLLQMSFIFGLAFAVFEGVFSLYAQKHLELESDQTGYLLAYVGLLVAFIQGGLIGRLAQRFSEERLIVGAAIVLMPSLIGWAYAPSTLNLMVVLIPLSLSLGVLSATIHSVLTKQVQHQEVGGILGLASAVGSITRIIGPIVGAILLDVVGTWAPGIFSALLVSWLLVYAWRYFAQSESPRPVSDIRGETSQI